MLDFPNSPVTGQTFTSGSVGWIFDGVKWSVLVSDSSGGVTISDTAPVSPAVGELWWDSVGAQLYTFYNDGNSSQFVVANQGSVGPQGPTGATGPQGPTGPTGAGSSIGVIDGSNAAAGHIGEYQTAQLPSAAAVTLTTSVNADLVTLTLAAGDWDVWGSVFISAGGNVLSLAMGWLSTASATVPTPPNPAYHQIYSATAFLQQVFMPTGHTRISSATAVTVYLSALTFFNTGSVSAYGIICARRVR